MEQIIKQHITENLEKTKVHFKYSGIYYINSRFINDIAITFSVSRKLIFYYIEQMVPRFVFDIDNEVMRIYKEIPEIFEKNHTLIDVIDELKSHKLEHVSTQDYQSATVYRAYQRTLENSTTNKWDILLNYLNGTTD